ncbi:multiheme c-type cytochrome [Novipirellula caenicola]|uniref:Cytochrome c-552/4 domain-containing protein n=1 Tax=Novipirellula caenicola TaxID=1536901 RepID=A0ABP9W172_9BACT
MKCFLSVLIGLELICFADIAVAKADEPTSFVGISSCATSTCHGGVIGRGPVWNHSLSTWLANDPHANAGRLLYDRDSQAIVSRLDRSASGSREAYDAVLRERCISCHTTATAAQTAASGKLSAEFLASGVTCESCHGAAESWLVSHTHVDWDPAANESMREMDSIIGRGETCVRCHIGSRTEDGLVRDMNHDLIAAGHPALRFDLPIYLANLPTHWDDRHDRELNASSVRLRAVGRAINLAAAAKLASERASDHLQDPTVPWPEFADYDCFACHQSLSIRNFQVPLSNRKKSPLHVSDGLPVWNAWHSVNQLELRENTALLEKLSPHRSDPKQIAASGQTLAVKYRKIAQQLASETVDPREKLSSMQQRLQDQPPPVDWHQAAIEYLELDALLRDFNAMHSGSLQEPESLQELEQSLRFQPEPSAGSGGVMQSPADFDPAKFRRMILRILQSQLTSTLGQANPE